MDRIRQKLLDLLKEYSLEEILEIGNLEVIDVLEYLVIYGALSVEEVIEATDTSDTNSNS